MITKVKVKINNRYDYRNSTMYFKPAGIHGIIWSLQTPLKKQVVKPLFLALVLFLLLLLFVVHRSPTHASFADRRFTPDVQSPGTANGPYLKLNNRSTCSETRTACWTVSLSTGNSWTTNSTCANSSSISFLLTSFVCFRLRWTKSFPTSCYNRGAFATLD